MDKDIHFTVSDFVAVLNQTLEFAYPSVLITGELANFKVNKNRWVFFDLKDELASVRFFATVQQLPGPLEDGMMLSVRGVPRMHPLYGFSVTVQFMSPVGEGSLKKAANLLHRKLEAEGLFHESRKRSLPYPPKHIGLVTSAESAAYKDFVTILKQRWGGVVITVADVQVQGEPGVAQVADAIAYFNNHADDIDVIVVTRGGGSADDLAVFSTEQVTRAIAGSRIPTVVAIGHEVDICLAELAADRRASTPSNAAELLVPDRRDALRQLSADRQVLWRAVAEVVIDTRERLLQSKNDMYTDVREIWRMAGDDLQTKRTLLSALNPEAVFARGFAMIQSGGKLVRSAADLSQDDDIVIRFQDGERNAKIT